MLAYKHTCLAVYDAVNDRVHVVNISPESLFQLDVESDRVWSCLVLYSDEDLHHFIVHVLLCERRRRRSSRLRVQVNGEPPLQSAAVAHLNICKGNTKSFNLTKTIIDLAFNTLTILRVLKASPAVNRSNL